MFYKNENVELYPALKKRKTSCDKDLHVRSDFVLQNDDHNGWFLIKDNKIVRFRGAVANDEDSYSATGEVLKIKYDFFERPFKSSHINIYVGNTNDLEFENIVYSCDRMKCKLIALGTGKKGEFVFIPVNHTLVG